MEAYLSEKLTQDSELLAVFENKEPEAWFFAATALGEGPNPAAPPVPYMVWNELPDRPYEVMRKGGNSRQRSFNISIYDHRGGFTRINNGLYVVRRIVKEMSPFQLDDGTICSDSDWGGISGNLTDSQYDANLKFGIARFTVNQ